MSDISPKAPLKNEDEISLYEIYAILRRKRWLILGTTIACAILAGAYAFIRPTNYRYQACVTMGVLGPNNKGHRIYIDSPASAIAQLRNVYIHSVIDGVLNGREKPQFNTNQFKTFNPKGSSLVCIKTLASKGVGDRVRQIQNTALQLLVNDNARMAAVPKASAEAKIKQREATAQTLSTKIANVRDQERVVNSELALLKIKDAVIHRQDSRLTQEIHQMIPLAGKASHEVHGNASALTMMIQNNQVAQEQRQLFYLEMERSFALPKEQVTLLNQLRNLKRQETNLDAQVATNAAQLKLAKASLKALQATHIVRPSSPSIEPVGPGKGVLVILGAFAGLMLSVFYALLSNALSREKHEIASNP
jgi:LPS O-antigen subunit length determinant protein (WzzB/FepE family)